MMTQVLQLKKAARRKAFLKMGITAPAGGGKTAGSLLIAYGLMKEKYPKLSDAELWSKVAIIDTENGSGELYVNSIIANTRIGEYNAITLTAPFSAEKYISAIDVCESNGIEVAIIDSTTHLWAGEGGLLEKQNMITAKSKSGNSYAAWREVTPDHNRFVEKMLQSNLHVIATMRSKMEYVQERDEKGSNSVRKLGLKPVQREGMEYEFTVFLDIDDNHSAVASKDRTGLLDGKVFKINPQIGQDLMAWLEAGTDDAPVVLGDSRGKPELKSEISKMVKANPDVDYKEQVFSKYGNPNEADVPTLKQILEDMEAITPKENN
jgi:hypothetical protein